jgi:ribonuclease J
MEICTVGGYEEVGKNMTAINLGEDVILFDAGLHLPSVIELQGSEEVQSYSEQTLRKVGAIPNDLVLDKMGWKEKVCAIVIGHAHLDHVGAVPYIAGRYPEATIYATPFTMEVLKSIVRDDKLKLRNRLEVIKPDSTFLIHGKNQKYKMEFVHMTHSTIQCVFPVLHTSEGAFVYGLDFKFDNYPTFGNPPNYKRLKELGKEGVKLLVVDALYSGVEKRPGGERIAEDLLEDAYSKVRDRNSALFITTFSSHIERLNNIVKLGKKTGRRIIFLGRSLNKYVECAAEIGKCPFIRQVQLIKFRGHINSILRKVNQDRGKYLVVCTGHQAEDGSILDRISRGETPFEFKRGDNLIFSSSVIPVYPNITAREKLDKRLRLSGVKIQSDVHVHGHGSREDLRELIELLNPKNVIPAHGSLDQETPMIDLLKEYNYKFGENSHLSENGKVLKI